jgi:TctA family transporter
MYIGNVMLVILNTVFIPVFVAAARVKLAFLALVLGDTMEATVRQSLPMSHGDLGIFFSRPLSAALMSVALAMALFPLVMFVYRKLSKCRGNGQ